MNRSAAALDRALLLDYRAYCEKKPEKVIQLVKKATALITEITQDNALLAANLWLILDGFYKQAGKLEQRNKVANRGFEFWSSMD